MVGALIAALALQGPSHVAVKQVAQHWLLTVDGKPFTVKGAGGSASWPLLASVGGNATRTWGADGAAEDLAKAQKAGIKVMVGIWLGHAEHGFHYDDPAQVQKQFENAKAVIEKYKDNPAVLMWGIGNEMENYGQGDDPNLWTAVEDIAHMAHKLDPNHPTATIVAEVGGKKIPAIHRMCPSIDIIGINSYAGCQSIYDRYVKQGGVKPYIITECGPPGTWEAASTPWNRPIELSSTEKEGWYEKAYKANVVDHPDLCLGCLSFIWGNKQEATATWFGMFLADGTRLGAVDAMQKLWSGKAPEHPCPHISKLTVDGDPAVDSGDTVQAHLIVADPKGDNLNVRWSLTGDSGVQTINGDKEDVPDTIPGAVTASTPSTATVKMPTTPGTYRLFAVVRNQHGGAAVANVPLRVRGAIPLAMGAKVNLPYSIYSGTNGTQGYIPSGWMGNAGAMKIDMASTANPHSGDKCIRWDYTAGDSWGAIAWQSPEGDWGDKPGGFDLTGAKKLTLWARGQNGGEKVSFGVGIIKNDKKYADTAIVDGGKVELTQEWRKFTVDLSGKNLSRIKTGLLMTIGGQGQGVTVYISDIQFE
ncbi:MAG: glycoside hydrolase family 2 TIM barrel-domain containing protein [Fimbriimonas sp.]|nr:glycoside hydrolase family 2 TIM barrel-domain containing protein [Fimbriimonas sp.]